MRPHERPPRIWPVVLATLVGLAILVSLGVWQVQRLHWKEGLLAQLAANAAADPVDLATAVRLAEDGKDDEFLRVKFSGHYKNDAWKKMISTYDGGQGWTIITPAISDAGRRASQPRRCAGARLSAATLTASPADRGPR